jgi:hypothetical protein
VGKNYNKNIKVVFLQGGLGNQLFQFAFARALEIKFRCTVKFDMSFFDEQSKRTICLDKFNIIIPKASNEEIQASQILKRTVFNSLFDYFKGPSSLNSLCFEKSLFFNEAYLMKKHKTYFKGYWQSEKYFKDFKKILIRELSFKLPPSKINAQAVDALKLEFNSVSLHVRRGDYVSELKANEIHGICGLEYYLTALNLIEKKIGSSSLKVYLFSDDISWVKKNLKTKYSIVYVDWNNDLSNYEDLRLMSLCKHNIIANSTFSWWGAWLNENPNKIVIAPRNWFADFHLNQYSDSIVPASWIRI